MSDSEEQVLWAKFALTPEGWVEGASVTLKEGRITHVEQVDTPRAGSQNLGEVALVPGQVNAHSHAFQRLIRGRTEYLRADRASEDFWSWREAMYGAVLGMDVAAFGAVAKQVFTEMLLCGITTVGEFHYVHHDQEGRPYKEDVNMLANVVIEAAREVGIRIVLLRVAYERAGFGKQADPMQRRFTEPDVETYLSRTKALHEKWHKVEGVSVGYAPHSIRAVSGEWMEAIVSQKIPGLPVHLHANEQRQEVEQSVAEYGVRPIEYFEQIGLLGENTTLVHATHVSEREIELMARHKALVCACPSTERNLGDGFLPARELVTRGVRVCVGSDSHSMIDPWEEMRLVEYHERLRYERRNVLVPTSDEAGRLEPAKVLWEMGTTWGAQSLGLEDVGQLKEGGYADLVGLDLEHVSIQGADCESLLSTVVFSAKPGAVRHVWSNGRQCVKDKRHIGVKK